MSDNTLHTYMHVVQRTLGENSHPVAVIAQGPFHPHLFRSGAPFTASQL